MTMSVPLIIAFLIVAALTAAGMAIRSVSRIWLRHWAEQQLRGAGAAATYLERPDRLLTAGNAGVAVTLLVSGIILGTGEQNARIFWSVLAYAGIVVVAGQIVPRAIARRWPAPTAALLLPLLRVVELVMAPVSAIGRSVAKLIVRERAIVDEPPERDAIQDLLREGELEGVGEREEIKIISGVVDFSEKVVRQVMTPRSDVFALPDGVDPHTLATQIAQSRYSRVPIFHGTLDNIVGMVHAFDVIKAHRDTPATLRPVAFASPESPCNELLFRMLRERLHLAIVRDASLSHTRPRVHLEDLLEELVGDIRDEHDEL